MAENFQNFYVTKLREACDASATTIYVDNPPNFSEGTLVLEFSNSTKHEIIHFTGKSGYSLTGCTRGHEGTTAQSHSAGVDVRQNVTAGILDKIINRAITTENIADKAVTTAKIDDEAVDTGQIADGAVTSDKIDFTTINASYRGSFNFTSAPASWSDLSVSGTLPKGKYLCISSGTIGGVTSAREIQIRFHTSENEASTPEVLNITQSPYWWNYCYADILELNNAGTISFQRVSGSATISGLQTFGCKMFVIKIS